MTEKETQTAIFRSYRSWVNSDSPSVPTSTQNEIPKWYKEADRFAKMPSGESIKHQRKYVLFQKREQLMIMERFQPGKHAQQLWMVFQQDMF